MSVMPPRSSSTLTRVAPASSEFSTSSLTTLAGRSTTSPAAIWLARSTGNVWMRPMAPLALPQHFGRRVEVLARSPPGEGGHDQGAAQRVEREPERVGGALEPGGANGVG